MEKINKAVARKMYNNGKKIMLCPCKMRPERFGVNVSIACGRSFDSLVNEFEYYNCSQPTGDYAAYYIDK